MKISDANTLHLILGGARSGKSSLAENIAKQAESAGLTICYLATAQAHDAEMSARILQHQGERPQHWQLLESPLYLAEALQQALQSSDCVLVDCLTLWLSNCLCHQDSEFYRQQKSLFIEFITLFISDTNAYQSKKLIFVSNEVGHGIVPMGELSRQFVDQAGWLHQELATLAKQVDFVIAGLPLTLKSDALINKISEQQN
ncbi:bifunctional adenosylcobinamide kinase/adenosylcobinamide-phosphate guanylyltransferase [Colwellia sp. BRX8-7]|jgi:adenosylcobinamide kinase/adenosylcobinamide-phosphate guanylyltransferase|uniref:bifunctional adenosylcobinamide kinase/adenosylcobinamide-phosphate guanylyltransferase n=1 Tax=unclassified Colwellia TaxID=196834 RepID=UPI0015F39C2C|nr:MULTISPECIES: bifunctional adenosylcobinamide kinase/adenosylcobinamide-phosphate guanylyltransferase [unclassified Colwellia]MBA6337355.1 bifunctional adenosylcobinamide kinase/adenosylcobinamide-phosphate guanylyltransferase [Colwellia sp. BRX8-7]MBA6351656.1 bifunctional adenosylcobinamide kinase/adenosylcobinamide-phosphate guanylyltransferase [Colwellia sp. BRX9-1]